MLEENEGQKDIVSKYSGLERGRKQSQKSGVGLTLLAGAARTAITYLRDCV